MHVGTSKREMLRGRMCRALQAARGQGGARVAGSLQLALERRLGLQLPQVGVQRRQHKVQPRPGVLAAAEGHGKARVAAGWPEREGRQPTAGKGRRAAGQVALVVQPCRQWRLQCCHIAGQRLESNRKPGQQAEPSGQHASRPERLRGTAARLHDRHRRQARRRADEWLCMCFGG